MEHPARKHSLSQLSCSIQESPPQQLNRVIGNSPLYRCRASRPYQGKLTSTRKKREEENKYKEINAVFLNSNHQELNLSFEVVIVLKVMYGLARKVIHKQFP